MSKLDLEISMKDRTSILNYCELIANERDFKKRNEYVDRMVKLISLVAIEDYKLSITSY
jgi:hypothetical protein